MREETVLVGGARVRYKVAGEGEPVLLLHGLSGSTRWWRPVVPALAERYRLYLLDLPGFGSRRHRVPWRPFNEVSAWIVSWMDAVGIGPAHVVGHSMGGALAVRLAVDTPQRVQRLVLVDAAVVPISPYLPGYALPFTRAVRRLAPAFLPVLAFDAIRAGPRTLRRAAVDLLQQDLRPDLGRVQAPTLIIWGAEDTLVPLPVGRLLRDEIPQARLVVLPHAGHVPMYDDPVAFDQAVLPFFEEGKIS
ncbi:MAG TPA: alpha/beta fold hydrolase [Chloroflexota bacterium]|nr:alpha/beta fold hydrolase [Chloroflexota bacterium]